MLSCLAIRTQTRIHYNNVQQPFTALLQEDCVDSPVQFRLNAHAYVRKIPDMLDRIYARIVQPTGVDQSTRIEADDYKRHAD